MNSKKYLFSLALFALFCSVAFLRCSGPPGSTCPDGGSCDESERCQTERCSESSANEVSTDASEPKPEVIPRETPHWSEGTWPPPEGFRDRVNSSKAGTKGAGQLCDPRLDALPQDRCKDGYFCAPVGSLSVGICVKKCKGLSDCRSDQRCVEIASPSDLIPAGRGCLMTAVPGGRCSYGIACPDGYICSYEGSLHWGSCRKACKNRGDCKSGYWCSSGVNIFRRKALVCKVYRKSAGGTCGTGVICGSGLTCVTKGKSQRCLPPCGGGRACPAGFICKEHLIKGKKSNYCFPVSEEGGPCDDGLFCPKGTVCAPLKEGSLCLKSCGADGKCPSGEKCSAVGSVKFCSGNSPGDGALGRGERCHPSPSASYKFRCKKGFRCLKLREVYRCIEVCDKDSDCAAGGTCEVRGGAKVCIYRVENGKSCFPSGGVFCKEGRCILSGTSERGVCKRSLSVERGKECLPGVRDCREGLVCSGDPLFPFRWICREGCNSGGQCGGGEVCVSLAGGVRACFSPCLSDGKCANNLDRCINLIKEKVCVR